MRRPCVRLITHTQGALTGNHKQRCAAANEALIYRDNLISDTLVITICLLIIRDGK